MRFAVDTAMAVLLLGQTAQQFVEPRMHEGTGMTLAALFIVHNLLNVRWYAALARGPWSALRILQTAVNAATLAGMAGMVASGIGLSGLPGEIDPDRQGLSSMRQLHMVCVYGGLVAMSLHAGLHGRMIMAAMRKTMHIGALSRIGIVAVRVLSALICLYGAYAFWRLDLWGYITMQTQFAFIDTSQSVPLFLSDYVAVMALFACVGHYAAKLAGLAGSRKRRTGRPKMADSECLYMDNSDRPFTQEVEP